MVNSCWVHSLVRIAHSLAYCRKHSGSYESLTEKVIAIETIDTTTLELPYDQLPYSIHKQELETSRCDTVHLQN